MNNEKGDNESKGVAKTAETSEKSLSPNVPAATQAAATIGVKGTQSADSSSAQPRPQNKDSKGEAFAAVRPKNTEQNPETAAKEAEATKDAAAISAKTAVKTTNEPVQTPTDPSATGQKSEAKSGFAAENSKNIAAVTETSKPATSAVSSWVTAITSEPTRVIPKEAPAAAAPDRAVPPTALENPTAVAVVAASSRPGSSGPATTTPPMTNSYLTKTTTTTTTTTTAARTAPPQQMTKRKADWMDEDLHSAVEQTVRDLLVLLQSYGPLTLGQMEYNLPPSRRWPLSEILELLVALGLVQRVREETNTDTTAPSSSSSTTTSPTTTTAARYCVARGVPREHAVLPTTLQRDIQLAHDQANASWKRSQVLLDALKREDVKPKHVLKKLLAEYPELVKDPVYATAFRNCHVEVTERRKSTSHANKASRKTAAAATASAAAPPPKTT